MSVTAMDIYTLAKDPSPGVRAALAGKIVNGLERQEFTNKEKEIAMDIMRILARDIEMQVRRSIALALSDSITAPHDIIWRLANDIAEVALPVLEHSPILTEEDLIAIVQSTEEVVKLISIAKRDSVSEQLSDALAQTGEQKVLQALLQNKGAIIGETTLTKRFETFTASPTLVEALVHRGGLSIRIAEKLFAVVSDELKRHLAKTYRLPMALVEDNIEDIREWTTLGMLVPDMSNEGISGAELEEVVDQLYISNRLTYSMIIRALCSGDIAFFETAMARFAGVPRANARLLMFDSGPLGFKAFYEKAKMPPAFFDAIRTILRISLELTAYGRVKREDFRDRVIEHIRNQRLDQTVENMQYLLTVMGGQFVQRAAIH